MGAPYLKYLKLKIHFKKISALLVEGGGVKKKQKFIVNLFFL